MRLLPLLAAALLAGCSERDEPGGGRPDPPDAAPTSYVGNTHGDFGVVDSGGATYTIPIQVPPGTSGMQPRLALTYHSQRLNALAGMGWDLDGLATIVRCPQTYAQDGRRRGVRYDRDDRFCLGGQRLVAVEGDYGADGAVYHTELESWQRIVSHGDAAGGPSHFKVTQKDGTTQVFGSPDGVASVRATGTPVVRIWAISSTSDADGNAMAFDYTVDEETGEYLPQEIAYTRNGPLAASRFVRFTYEPRPDPSTQYIAGSSVRHAQRLRGIETYLGEDLVRRYALDYESSGVTGRSRLVSVVEFDAEGRSLPPTRLEWQLGSEALFGEPSPKSVTRQPPGGVSLPIDFNGDGLTDLVQARQSGADLEFAAFLRAEGGFQPPEGRTLPPTGRSWGGRSLPLDFNGDGLVDVLYANNEGGRLTYTLFPSTGEAFEPATGTDMPATGLSWGGGSLPADVNGDGLGDVVHAANVNGKLALAVFLSDGKRLRRVPDGPLVPTDEPYGGRLLRLDLNGDGMTDLVNAKNRNGKLALAAFVSDGQGSFEAPGGAALPLPEIDFGGTLVPLDVNGDSNTDMVHAQNANGALRLSLLISTGTELSPASLREPVLPAIRYGGTLLPSDVNGDGWLDLLIGWDDDGKLSAHALLSTGEDFRPPQPVDTGELRWGGALLPADLTGNGMSDMLFAASDGQQLALREIRRLGSYPDLLASVTNGFGGTTRISYAPLTDRSVHHQTRAALGTTLPSPSALSIVSGATFPFSLGTDLPGGTLGARPGVRAVLLPIYVVARYEITPSEHTTYAYACEYADGAIDRAGRGWLGFAARSVTDESRGATTRHTYLQEFPFTGNITSTTISSEAAGVLRADHTVYEVNSSHTAVRHVTTTSERRVFYVDGTPDTSSRVDHTYDAYGNATLSVARGGPVGADDGGIPTYTARTYHNDLESWRIGFVTSEKISTDAAGNAILRWEKSVYEPRSMALAETQHFDDSTQPPSWFVTHREYDAYGNAQRIVDATGAVSETEYDAELHTFPVRRTLPANSAGVRASETHEYDPRFGSHIRSTDVNGHATKREFDRLGREVAAWGPDPSGDSALLRKRSFLHGPSGTIEETLHRLDWSEDLWRTERRFRDGLGRVFRTTEDTMPGGPARAREQAYDSQGEVVSETDWFFPGEAPPRRTTKRDALGRATLRNRPTPGGTRETAVSYGTGHTETTTVTSNTDLGTTARTDRAAFAFFHDGWQAIERIDPSGGRTRFDYDALGRIVHVADPVGVTTSIRYDSLGQRALFEESSGGQHAMTFDHGERQATETRADGSRVDLSFDRLGRVVAKTTHDDVRTTFEYDDPNVPNSVGRLTAVRLPSGVSYAYTYGSGGNRTSITMTLAGREYTTHRSHRPDGSLSGVTYPDESAIRYRYDDAGRLASLHLDEPGSDATTAIATFSDHTANGRPGRTSLGNGVEEVRTFHDTGHPRDLVISDSEATLLSHAYVWANAEQLAATRDEVDAARSETYGYDASGRIVAATGIYGSASYAYDAAGNLTEKEGVEYRYEGHLLREGFRAGTAVLEVEHDAAGRMSQQRRESGTFDYSYDTDGRLREVRKDRTPTLAFAYNHLGERIAKRNLVEGSTTFYVSSAYEVFDAGDGSCSQHTRIVEGPDGPIAALTSCVATAPAPAAGPLQLQRDGPASLALACGLLVVGLRRRAPIPGVAGARARRCVAQLLIVSMTHLALAAPAGAVRPATAAEPGEAEITYLHHNLIHSTLLATDAGGRVNRTLAYRPFGAIHEASGPGAVRRDFGAKEFDAESGLHYFGARYYDAAIGRFITPDSRLGAALSAAGAFNRYAFALNDPVNRADPTGHSSRPLWLITTGFVLELLAIAILAYVVPMIAVGEVLAAGGGEVLAFGMTAAQLTRVARVTAYVFRAAGAVLLVAAIWTFVSESIPPFPVVLRQSAEPSHVDVARATRTTATPRTTREGPHTRVFAVGARGLRQEASRVFAPSKFRDPPEKSR